MYCNETNLIEFSKDILKKDYENTFQIKIQAFYYTKI